MKVSEITVSYRNSNPKRIKISNSRDLFNLASQNWNMGLIEYQEEVKIFLLNKANIVLGIYEVSKGGITSSIVDFRIILGVALKCNAVQLVLMHNHPSGNLKPSDADISITKKLKQACGLLEITLLDHLIVREDGYYSFSDSGML
jgi:DNA repair proteins